MTPATVCPSADPLLTGRVVAVQRSRETGSALLSLAITQRIVAG